MAGFRGLLVVAVLASFGCFSEPQKDLPPGCSLGRHLCPCDDGSCDPGLTCSVSADVCVAIDCEVGALECPCGGNGACNPALVCGEYGYCVPEDGTQTTGDPTVASSMSDSMSASVTSETMSSTDVTTASTSSDPDTGTSGATDSSESSTITSATMSTTESESESESATDTTDVTTNDTTVLDVGGGACSSMVDCDECVFCAQQADCSAIWDECTDAMQGFDPACVNGFMTYYQCVTQQPGEGPCQQCEGASELADELFLCLAASCSAQCSCLAGL